MDESPNPEKTRIRGCDWTVFVYPDEKNAPWDLVGETVGDALMCFAKKTHVNFKKRSQCFTQVAWKTL
jgi:hypothetical protein